ncbi:MAG: ion transporter [Pseudomonadales bacterium]|nr:ion transporter [Pseudomonadales bacterium]MCP5172450.1 ion transporter [Pseudomonadales bacterium]
MVKRTPLRQQLYSVIFGTDTPAGQWFDLLLIYAILLSVFAVSLDSVAKLHESYGNIFYILEWTFTILFTIEYIARVYCCPSPRRYIFSYYGLIDLVSIVPTYLALFMTGASYLLMIRLLRVLRIFRVLKLARYLTESTLLMRALYLARRKILIFFSIVLVLSTIFGSLMFVVEGPGNGFTSIPKSIYWTIVTITTVGYGDITPHTVLGQLIATISMMLGYSIIAIPTGIVTAELATEMQRRKASLHCRDCHKGGHDEDAEYCKWCGGELP